MQSNDFNELRGPINPEERQPSKDESTLEQQAHFIAEELAHALDQCIRNFVNAVEGRDVSESEILHGLRIVKLGKHATEKPDDWENFIIWRRHVLAYCTVSGSHFNENDHAATMEYTLKTCVLPEENWPDSIRLFLAIK